MKPITWLALGAAFVALALFAGKDDIRRFRACTACECGSC